MKIEEALLSVIEVVAVNTKNHDALLEAVSQLTDIVDGIVSEQGMQEARIQMLERVEGERTFPQQ